MFVSNRKHLFLIMALVSTAYIFVNFNALLNRAGRYTGMDTIIGFILILSPFWRRQDVHTVSLLPGLVVYLCYMVILENIFPASFITRDTAGRG